MAFVTLPYFLFLRQSISLNPEFTFFPHLGWQPAILSDHPAFILGNAGVIVGMCENALLVTWVLELK